ncbi:hypothetical protein BGW36DRAFT_360597 [Talaromyces proteolyticus]|uniref:Uncharacterized protein n=1 Tax=Talaromyces proteolyticus TaxID=1131652 RepID=A0AAD4PUA0_9EURO|nr:uncharacterized protein BGW36DRAFT_360597 [Talaromyces proteolyticus]KAH8694871.1 hypothetical protein BGW36DRAFT_360597 [Talaromyces proteolyticus]
MAGLSHMQQPLEAANHMRYELRQIKQTSPPETAFIQDPRGIEDAGNNIELTPFNAGQEYDPLIDHTEYDLPPLNHKPFFLQPWVLLCAVLINVGWTIWLAIAYSRPVWQGPEFILGGLFSGYVATATKFVLSQQVRMIGKIMPYRNMRYANCCNVKETIDSDYWPYEWPFVRFRALRNGDHFFQLVDIVAFVFTSAIIEFESNILGNIYDTTTDYSTFIGYGPNRGVILISIICHVGFILTSVGILAWLQFNETGLREDPGCLALYLTMFSKEDIQKDFQGIEDEDRRWVVRKRLTQNEYRIGYWRKGQNAVYGIRRKIHEGSFGGSAEATLSRSGRPRKHTEYPEFRYVPWFLKPFWIVVWVSMLAASLAILSTLVIRDSIIDNGFDPRVSTAITPFVDISPAAFLWSFFPAFMAELFLLLLQSIDTFYRLVQPYVDLKRKTATKDSVIKSFRINYINDLPVVVSLRALKNGHTKVALISLFALFAELSPGFAANMFYVQGDWMWVWTRYYWPVLVYLCLLILFLLWIIPTQKRNMPRDLETIADHMALFSQSSLLDGGKFQVEEELREKSRTKTNWISSASKVLISPQASISQLKKRLIGPSTLVEEVAKKIRLGSVDNLPRFGIWQGNGSFIVGIDSESPRMISLFEDNYYKPDWEDIINSYRDLLC